MLLFTVALHFHDDTFLLGFSWERGGAQYCNRQLRNIPGEALGLKKSPLTASKTAYVGVNLEFTRLSFWGDVFSTEIRTCGKHIESIGTALSENRLPQTEAYSLVGKLSFLGAHAAGRVLRGCLGPLARTVDLDIEPFLNSSFPPIRAALTSTCFSQVHALWPNQVSCSNGRMQCGIHLHQGLVSSCARHGSSSLWRRGAFRPVGAALAREQIDQIEAPAWLGPWNHPDIFRSRSVVHLNDNTSALSGSIKALSSVPDSNIIFQLHGLSLAASGWRQSAEYVNSSANLADEPVLCSRDCPVVASLGAQVKECTLPPFDNLWTEALIALLLYLLHLQPSPSLLIWTCRDCGLLSSLRALFLWHWERRGV